MLYPFEVLRSGQRSDGVWEVTVRTADVESFVNDDHLKPMMLFKQLDYYIKAETLDEALQEVAHRVVNN